jgi:SAM-dependent methyltransferase
MRPIAALRLRARDALDRLPGRRDRLTPPRRLRGFVGDSDFAATGEELARLLEEAGLQPGDRVLDIGCGIGRVARALTTRLGPDGGYEGFDVSAEAVAWCARHYRRRHPGFQFTFADVRNARYNPGGVLAARDFRFPYDDASFDLALSASVFTHLLADGTDRYLAEAARVLRPGGRLVATFFLLDGEARRLQADGQPVIRFRHEHWPVMTADADEPEAAVGYDEGWVRDRFGVHGLTLQEPVRHGSWSGRPAAESFQDAVVARRAGA